MPASYASPLLVSVAWVLVHSLWQGIFIWAMYRIARAVTRDAAMRCHIGHACLVVFVAAQLLTFWHVAADPGEPQRAIPLDTTFLDLEQERTISGRYAMPELPLPARVGTWMANNERYLPLLTLAWSAGLTFQVLRTLGALYFLQRHLDACADLGADLQARFRQLAQRIGISRPVRFLESTLVTTPATARWLKPVVLVPAATLLQMPVHQLEALILHELAHIKRYDYATNILRTFIRATYFFHPLIHNICGHISDDAELATDALAAGTLGDRKAYADSLLALEERRRSAALLLGVSGGNLKSRIVRLVQQQHLPATPARQRISLSGTVLAGVLGVVLLGQAAAWASQERQTMSLLTSQSLSQIVVETFSRPSQSDDFIVPLEQAMREIAQTQHVTEGTAVELADAILKDVDPDALYRYVCAQPDKINFRSFRDMEFGPFGSSVQRSCLVDELYMHALRAPDAEQRARHARAALVFASLQLVFDSGRTALLLLQQPGFVQTLDLSEQQYRLLRLTVAVHNDRLARVGSSLSAEQTTLRGASDEQVKQFTAELSHLPAFQLTLCNKMSRGFQQRVVDVLKRDRTAYADRSLRYVRRWCLTDPEVAAKAR